MWQIKVFSNYGDGLVAWGKEEVVTNYMELSEDPKGEWIRSGKYLLDNHLLFR